MRQKVLFVSHDLVPEGGGGVVASWMLEALVSSYDVTVLSWKPPDFAALDRKFGTSLARTALEIVTPSALERRLVDSIPDDCSHQRANYLVRMAKRRRHAFEVVIACSFESDLGGPGIQYIHYPYLARRSRQWTVPGDAPLGTIVRALLSGRLRPWMVISGYSFDRMRRNLTLTNSHWTRGEMGGGWDMAIEVVYPPAPGEFVDVPWEQRQDAFVCAGRLHPFKRQDWIADTLAVVRREWPRLELHICGSNPAAGYVQRLEELAKAHGPWVRIRQDLSRAELASLLSNCRYGIHARVDEHFGIAPAEMARAGCIPFVHSSGGQVEIVDRDPRLCFTTAEDAAAKILAVLRDRGLQDELRTAVHRRSERFTPEAFMRAFLGHVERFLSTHAGPEGGREMPWSLSH